MDILISISKLPVSLNFLQEKGRLTYNKLTGHAS